VALILETVKGLSPDARRVELVERKGLGHPDTICDRLAEELSLALSRFYRERCGRVLHHNVDKSLLWAGRASSAFGGGRVLEPIEIFLAGRAALDAGGVSVPIETLAVDGSRDWLRANFHALDAWTHVRIHPLVRPGSTELVELFGRSTAGRAAPCNDTSIGVGYAPLSELEEIVLRVEQHLNSEPIRLAHPEIGQDIKILGVRRDDDIALTVACAFVDRHVASLDDYADKKAALALMTKTLAERYTRRAVAVALNGADDPGRGSVYTTVTGTSAEAGDDGQAGRGNRANGLITPGRPMTMESVAGKNPITHVGKLYNLAAHLIAADLVARVPGAAAAECRLVSLIGQPLDRPQIIEVRLDGAERGALHEARRAIEGVVEEHLAGIGTLWEALLDGRLQLDRWPLLTEL
jgi:S-adenosylmethionine synthetase